MWGDGAVNFVGRMDAKAETPILWLPDVKNWLIGKDPDAGKDWRQGEKGMTEDETVGWHHWLNRHEFEQTPGVGDGQGSLVCCSPWGHKESDTTEQLNWTGMLEMKFNLLLHTNEKTGIERLSESQSKLMIEQICTIMVLARYKFNVSIPLSFSLSPSICQTLL